MRLAVLWQVFCEPKIKQAKADAQIESLIYTFALVLGCFLFWTEWLHWTTDLYLWMDCSLNSKLPVVVEEWPCSLSQPPEGVNDRQPIPWPKMTRSAATSQTGLVFMIYVCKLIVTVMFMVSTCMINNIHTSLRWVCQQQLTQNIFLYVIMQKILWTWDWFTNNILWHITYLNNIESKSRSDCEFKGI